MSGKKKFAHTKISSLLNLIVGAVFIVAAVMVVILVNDHMRRQALVEAESKARILLDHDLATHTYFSHDLKPRLFEWTAPFRSDDYFDPVWMSSTFAVREIDKYFRSLNPADYYYKECAINARSPDNEADAYERAFIDELNANPGLQERSVVRTLDGDAYFVTLRRGEVMEAACLRCHSTPDQAPEGLVSVYGAERSFGREVGDVVSAISIRVPLAAAYAEANRFSLRLSGLLLTLLFGLFVVQSWFNRRLLFVPLDRIRDKTLQILAGGEYLGEEIPLPSGRELSELTAAFNAMSIRLRRNVDQLEKRVEERTAALTAGNERLQREVVERKRAEEALRVSEEQWKSLVENSSDHIMLLDTDYTIRFINHTVSDLTREQVIGKSNFDFVPSDSHPAALECFERVARSGKAGRYETRYITTEGKTRYFDVRISPLMDKDGNITGFISTSNDVTERRQVEESLKFERQRFSMLIETFPGFIYLQAPDYSVRYANQYFVEHFGDPAGRLCHEVLWDCKEPCEPCPTFKVFETKIPQIWEWSQSPDGRVYVIYDHPFVDSDGCELVLEIGVDITERKRAEEALRESKEIQDVILSNTDVLFAYLDREFNFVAVNQAYADAGHKRQEDFIGKNHFDLYPDAENEAIFNKVVETGEAQLFSAKPFKHPDQPDRGTTWWKWSLIPMKDESGNVQTLVFSLLDVTERVRAEEQVKASLREKETLLQEIHHRVKNNLAVISSLLKLQAETIQDERVHVAFRESQNRIQAMVRIHEHLYRSSDLARIDMAQYVRGVANHLLRSFGTRAIALRIDVADVELDIDRATPCGLIINELVSNALKHAFPPGWQEADKLHPAESGPKVSVGLRLHGGQCELTVGDNGVGLPGDLQIESMGHESLGLRLVNLLSRQLEGDLQVDREGGAIFRLTFAVPEKKELE